MAIRFERSVWEKKRQKAQPYINRIGYELERKSRWQEQIVFLQKCKKLGLIPNGLKVNFPANIQDSPYGRRLKSRNEVRVLKRSISGLFGKLKRVDEKVAGLSLKLKLELGMPEGWIARTVKWVSKSVRGIINKVRLKLKKKLEVLKKEKVQKEKKKEQFQPGVKKKVVYNNSSKKLSEEQINLLSLGLNFGITPKKFPLAEYVQATELLCQRLEEGDDDESVEKARAIRNEVFGHLKRSYKLKIRSNLSPSQRKVLRELMDDDSIIICPADKGKAVVVEDKIAYLMKTKDQLADGEYELAKGKERTIISRLHRKLMNQLKCMGIEEYKEQRKLTVTGPVMASIIDSSAQEELSRKGVCFANR